MSEIMEKLDYFTYKVQKFDNSFNDLVGDIFILMMEVSILQRESLIEVNLIKMNFYNVFRLYREYLSQVN